MHHRLHLLMHKKDSLRPAFKQQKLLTNHIPKLLPESRPVLRRNLESFLSLIIEISRNLPTTCASGLMENFSKKETLMYGSISHLDIRALFLDLSFSVYIRKKS